MNANAKLSQQDQDTRTQKELTSKVGTRLTRSKSTTSPWSAVKRVLRIG